MASEEPPDWLPDGWYMGLRMLQDGSAERVYTSPVSGYTFSSKSDVLHYLNFEKVEGHQPKSTVSGYKDHSENDSPQEDSPLWLPQGWILEIKTRKTGKSAGGKYKCYFDPSTGSRFYSKMEVFRFLEGEQARNRGELSKGNKREHIPLENGNKTSGPNGTDDSDSPDNVLSQIESSPDGLPPGWIKEIRYKRNASGIRKDPYYKDPVSGYVFRSKKDVFRYLETGVISRHAFKTKNSYKKYDIEEPESPPPISARSPKPAEAAARQCLFVSPSSSSKQNAGLSFEDGCFQHSDLVTMQRPTMSLITIPDANNLKESHSQVKNSSKIHVHQDCEPDLSERQKGQLQILEQSEVAEKFSAPVIDNLSSPSDMKVGELESEKSSESKHGKFPHLESSNKKNQTCIPSTRRHVKKLAVRRFPKNNVDALPDSSNRLPLQQPANISSDDLPSHNSTDAANDTASYLAEEKPSELERISCEKVDNRVDPNISEQADNKHKDILPVDEKYEPKGQFTEANKQLDTSREKAESGGMTSEKSEKKRKMADEMSSDARIKHVTQSRSIASTKTLSKDEKSLFAPHRSSRRLAGLDPDLTANIDVSFRSLRRRMSKENKPGMTVDQKDQVALKVSDNHETTLIQKATERYRMTQGEEPASPKIEPEEQHLGTVQLNGNTNESSGTLPSSDSHKKSKGKENASLDQEPEQECPGSPQTNGDKKREPPLASPFGDAWPDPCIEFAFKTLTGDIPIFDDSLNIKDYLQQHVSPTVSRTATSFGSAEEITTSNPPSQPDGMNDLNAISANVQQGYPPKNVRQAGGDMERTSTTVKVKN